MGFLKSRRTVEAKAEPWVTNWLAGKIAGGINRLQSTFADKMNNKVGNMNRRRLKVLLILFCVVVGGYSAGLIVKAVTVRPEVESSFRVEQIKGPSNLNRSGNESTSANAYVDDYTFGQIQIFKNHLDSLRTYNLRLYDSITAARPHLMDSVLALEELYKLQNKK